MYQDPEVIEKKIRGSYFSMVFTEIVVDVYNYSNPVSFEDRHYAMSMLGAGSAKTNSVNIKKVEIETDYGFFFEDRETVRDVSIDYIIRDLSPSEMYDDAFAIIYIFGGGNVDRFYRSYVKLQDVMANISGFMSTVLLIFGTLSYHYSKFRMYEKISNQAFCLARKNDHKLQTIKSIVKLNIQKKKSRKAEPVEPKKVSIVIEQVEKPMNLIRVDSQDSQNQEVKNTIPPKEMKRTDLFVHKSGSDHIVSEQMSECRLAKPEEDEDRPELLLNFPNVSFSDQEQKSEGGVEEEIHNNEVLNTESVPFTPFKSDNNILSNIHGVESDHVKIDTEEIVESKKDEVPICESLVPEFEPVRVKWWEWWLSFFKEVNAVKRVKKASQKVDEYLDISEMLNRFIQLERILDLILTKEQKQIFENLPPKVLPEDTSTSTKDRNKLLNQGILKLLKKDEFDQIDERLLELYEKSL